MTSSDSRYTPSPTPGASSTCHCHEHDVATGDTCCTGSEAPRILSLAPVGAPASTEGMYLLHIPAMDCAVEEGQIRRALENIPDITQLRFDLQGRVLGIDAPEERMGSIVAAIERLGFKTERLDAPLKAEVVIKRQRREQWRLSAALMVAIGAELFHFFLPEAFPWPLLGMGAAVIAIVLSGINVFRKGLSALLHGQLNINALMSVAVIGAFLIGQWPEAAMVMVLYSLAELIEAHSVAKARNAISGLLSLSPTQAEIRQPDGTWTLVDAHAVPVGAIARVKPGGRFALDGRVVTGQGAVDQSPVTGESIPVDKGIGDDVFAGTINQSGSLEFEVTQPASDTVLAGIIHAVEEAQEQKATTQRAVDRFAAYYTPGIFIAALVIAVGMPLTLGSPWLESIYKALVVLVIACPCALVISTPVTVVSGLAAAARQGILIKGGVYLEQARNLRVIALDKTGTITEGKPRLVHHQLLWDQASEQALLLIASSLAGRSDHPVSAAIATGLKGSALPVEHFGAEIGRGIYGAVNGHDYILGNHRWIHERGLCSPQLEETMGALEAQGNTLSILADAERVLVLFAVADTIRNNSRQAIKALRALGIRSIMLTGDNPATAQAIAQQVGIDQVRANLLPHDKQDIIAALSADQAVGMVGDGVNDSPSLVAATVGFTMGAAGTDTAKEAAEVIIMNDDLSKVAETIRLSRKTYAVLWQNISLALGIKAAFFILAVFGSATMWMAVFADMGASLLVVFNGLRMLRSKSAISVLSSKKNP